MNQRLAGLFVSGLVCSCQTAAVRPKSPQPKPTTAAIAAGSSGSPAEAYFPLQQGHVYRYRVIDTGAAMSKAIVRSVRKDAKSGSLLVPGGRKHFRYASDGVLQEHAGGAPQYVLKAPFVVGSHWSGKGRSRIEIEAIVQGITVPAGTYQDCIQTKEVRGGDLPIHIRTVFCRSIGMVRIEATAGGRQERMELESYDAPIQLGPDGVKVLRD